MTKDSLSTKIENNFIRISKEKKLLQYIKDNKVKSYSTSKRTINDKIKIIDSIRLKDQGADIALIDLSLIYPISDFDKYFIFLPKKNILLDNKNIRYSLVDALSAMYGSIDNLNEEISKYKVVESKDIFNEAKEFLRSDYITYQVLSPQDSIKTADMFLEDLSKAIHVNKFQRALILTNDWKDIKQFPQVISRDKYHIYLYNIDITNFLLSIFTDEQIFKYINYTIPYDIKREMYRDYFYECYLKENKDGKKFNDYLIKILYN
ncbi:hypothetical protein [Chryseobacterium pennae]|uniref:hypothetical protein n=1 Tax=Chryseobacterium pennae TaxID=2258962 RepID=UPI000F50D5B2|nr:hypothetical protein [Chryseobacterium pennae]